MPPGSAPASLMVRVTQAGEMVGGRQAGRPRPYHQHPLPVGAASTGTCQPRRSASSPSDSAFHRVRCRPPSRAGLGCRRCRTAGSRPGPETAGKGLFVHDRAARRPDPSAGRRAPPKLGNACACRPSRNAASASSSAALTTPWPPRPWNRTWNIVRALPVISDLCRVLRPGSWWERGPEAVSDGLGPGWLFGRGHAVLTGSPAGVIVSWVISGLRPRVRAASEPRTVRPARPKAAREAM